MSPPSASQFLEAGLLALGLEIGGNREPANKQVARQVLSKATAADPTLADAWLARLASGERTISVYEGLWRSRDRLGAALPRFGLTVQSLNVTYEAVLINHPLINADVATAAYIGALAAAKRYDEAITVAGTDSPAAHPLTTYAVTAVYMITERWPQVIATARPLINHHEPVLAAGARAVTVQALACVGLYQAAVEMASTPVAGSHLVDLLRVAAPTVHFYTAMSYRALGDEDRAQEALRATLIAAPDHAAAREMINHPELVLTTTTQEIIDSRTDPWDPATAADPAELERERLSERRASMLAEAEAELAEQIGLREVRHQIAKLKASIVVNQARVEQGLPPTTRSNHLVFTGPPGTGKTTVARIIAKIYCGLGILSKDTVKEVRKADLVGAVIGDTEKKTEQVIDSALGGVLFIDEAYTLATSGSKNDFGFVAIDTLLARLENDRDKLMVIVAGYVDEMGLFYTANEGIRSRFPKEIGFPSYSAEELAAIAELIASKTQHRFGPEALELLTDVCRILKSRTALPPLRPDQSVYDERRERPQIDIVGNGRFMRNVVEEAIGEQQLRLHPHIEAGRPVDHSQLTAADMLASLKQIVPEEFRKGLPWD